jgi:hypothetical protein
VRHDILHHRAACVHGGLRVEPHGFVEAPLEIWQLLHVRVRRVRSVAQNLVEFTQQLGPGRYRSPRHRMPYISIGPRANLAAAPAHALHHDVPAAGGLGGSRVYSLQEVAEETLRPQRDRSWTIKMR